MTARVSRARAFIYALIALALGGASYAVGVGSFLGQRAEQSVLDASEFTANPPAPLSLVSVWTVGGAILVLALLAWAIHGVARGLWYAFTAFTAIAVSQLLKQQVLVRPDLFDFDAANTFPSGHMTVFAVVAGGLVWACSARWRGLLGIVAAVIMGVVAWQLLAFGWHRPSDVLGALALGVLAVALAAFLRPPGRSGQTPSSSGAVVATEAIIGAVITLAGVALIAGGIVLALTAASSHSDELMLSAGQVALIGTSALAARAFMTLSR